MKRRRYWVVWELWKPPKCGHHGDPKETTRRKRRHVFDGPPRRTWRICRSICVDCLLRRSIEKYRKAIPAAYEAPSPLIQAFRRAFGRR